MILKHWFLKLIWIISLGSKKEEPYYQEYCYHNLIELKIVILTTLHISIIKKSGKKSLMPKKSRYHAI